MNAFEKVGEGFRCYMPNEIYHARIQSNYKEVRRSREQPGFPAFGIVPGIIVKEEVKIPFAQLPDQSGTTFPSRWQAPG